ncbi:helix-turn-helix transcriptional regulator [Gilvimarinus sp. SDUM040013]|uniref:Helix-turn-helix transcriptional regulator n=1 Tax=Gilvimarinus gilvus TaxID=3058038 RepID=A0ABU4RZ73_9GAMM|nr:helix-turn-helix transcriptional regulator [Gilvimarinus sp. SDUM040013]MDO3384564.1 helix-turn-helix transcriptional regulator [Gilvimarinus sp. SDUM040013]MDX6850100.1 helix-turn-helix transcriptional regulator [Gilvimarinus sp. SDUM040013]
MILKQLRIDRHLTQEQLAEMSGLNVRTVQRIERGHKASLESMKCLAAVLEVDVDTLDEEAYMVDKQSDQWQQVPLWVKVWFAFNFLTWRPTRRSAKNVEYACHIAGFIFCLGGLVSHVSLVGGLWLLAVAHFTSLLLRQGDYYGVWQFEQPSA